MTSGATGAGQVQSLFSALSWVTIFLSVLVGGLLLLFLLRRQPDPAASATRQEKRHLALRVLWTLLPLFLVAVLFVFGFAGFLDQRTPPRDAYQIQVIGEAWQWKFGYPNGYEDSELHVPQDRPVRLDLISADRAYSLSVPALKLKQDALPGQLTTAWFAAADTGSHELFCSQYCGAGHADMRSVVVVHDALGFDDWLAAVSDPFATMTPVEVGERLYQVQGCTACHTTNGTTVVGPSFQGLFDRARVLSDGTEITVDDAYIRESLVSPQAKVVKGFQPVMPPYGDKFNDRELGALIAYLKTLSESTKNDVSSANADTDVENMDAADAAPAPEEE